MAARVVRTAAIRVRLSVAQPVVVADLEEALGARSDGTDVVDDDVEAAEVRGTRTTSSAGASGSERSMATASTCPVSDSATSSSVIDRAPAIDLGALGDQGTRDGEADALARAGDDGDLVGEMQVHARDARPFGGIAAWSRWSYPASASAAMASALGVPGSAKYRKIDCPSVPTRGSRTYRERRGRRPCGAAAHGCRPRRGVTS